MSRKKIISSIVSFFIIMTLLTVIFLKSSSTIFGASDYGQALAYSIQFYDANKCGTDAGEDQSFDWRSACHTDDGSDVGLDLTGGYHDAGDHVKFGLPQGYTASVLGWSLYEFGDQMGSAKSKLISTLEYFTEYFKKCHLDSNTFYYQIGDGNIDHAYWGPPEEQTDERSTLYFADSSNPASDILGETSAALALMYLNTGDESSLQVAKELYEMGKANEGVGQGQSFYQSSGYADEMAWGACWLAEATGDSSYIEDAEYYVNIPNQYGDNMYEHKWAMCWDDMYLPVFFKLYELTSDETYANALDYNLNYWMNDLTTSPSGMKYLTNWGVLRYNSAQSFLALMRYEQTGNEDLKSFAQTQIDYILGDNPDNMSYMVGYGDNYPLCPHHRAANGYTYANGDNALPAKHILYGGLVGGPDQNDTYIDDVNQVQYTEVAIDYNAGLVGALAGIIKYEDGSVPDIPTTTTDPEETDDPDTTTDPSLEGIEIDYSMNDWGSGATVTITITNTGDTAIEEWTLNFDFSGNQQITTLWSAEYTQTGTSVSISDAGWNSTIPVGESVEFGFNISYSGSNEEPTNFTLN
jgi:hypothetical protein